MNSFLGELKSRNSLLYWFGLINLVCAVVCIALMMADTKEILGINRWMKPLKFFLSVAVMAWTMGWLMYYLDARRSVKVCSWLIVISMFIEVFIITIQSSRGTTSHFNITSPLNGILFSIMGIFILLFTLTSVYITFLFFRQKQFPISGHYLWAIRLGLVFFVFFSSEGGMMVQRMAHTVGAPDGGDGLPLINWSNTYGDLRVAHFFGIHALQVLPLTGYYLAKTKGQVFLFSVLYFTMVMVFLIQALYKIPVI
ncbi:MAG: hypothetical protein SFU87_14705 [Chitinophagaceae bacterium]|nr:hypothetical protein [Chitinophagaceae bacterium]